MASFKWDKTGLFAEWRLFIVGCGDGREGTGSDPVSGL